MTHFLYLDMKLVGIPILVFLVLCLAAILILDISSPFFLYPLFNIIILVIIFGSYRPYVDKVDGVFPSFPDEVGDDVYDNIRDGSDNSDDDDDYKQNYGSDGYEEDDDDNGSDGEIGWQDDEEFDDNLERRIEEFIAKVNTGWKEEQLEDNLHNQFWFG